METKSFTLIELLIVIVIIGVLSGIIIISTTSSISKANFAKAQAFSNTVQNELLGDLVSEWTFDEGNAQDTWGNNDGTVIGGATYQNKASGNCVYGGCYSFDGNNYIKIDNYNSFDFTQITLSAWVKTYASPPLDWSTIIAKGSQGDNNHFWLMYRSSSFRLEYGNGSIRTSAISNVIIPQIGTWYHVLGTYANGVGYIYINGVSGAPQTSLNGDLGTNDLNLTIGRASYVDAYYWNGLIDDVRIYKAALSTSKIKQEYIAGLNSLLANNNISKEEYDQRLNNLAYDKE